MLPYMFITIVLLTCLSVDKTTHTTRKKFINDMSLKSFDDTSLKHHDVDCHCIRFDYNDTHLKRHSLYHHILI